MIYWFTGQPGSGKTIQATKLKELLQTEKRNWRKDVFHIDEQVLNLVCDNTGNSKIEDDGKVIIAQTICFYLNLQNCDVVVSMISSNKKIRETFKKLLGNNIVEIYVHSERKKLKRQKKVDGYELPIENFFDMDTTSDNPVQTFTKLVHYLRENKKI